MEFTFGCYKEFDLFNGELKDMDSRREQGILLFRW